MTFIQVSMIRRNKSGDVMCQALSNKCKSKAKYLVRTDLFGDLQVCAKHKAYIMSKKALKGKVIKSL